MFLHSCRYWEHNHSLNQSRSCLHKIQVCSYMCNSLSPQEHMWLHCHRETHHKHWSLHACMEKKQLFFSSGQSTISNCLSFTVIDFQHGFLLLNQLHEFQFGNSHAVVPQWRLRNYPPLFLVSSLYTLAIPWSDINLVAWGQDYSNLHHTSFHSILAYIGILLVHCSSLPQELD